MISPPWKVSAVLIAMVLCLLIAAQLWLARRTVPSPAFLTNSSENTNSEPAENQQEIFASYELQADQLVLIQLGDLNHDIHLRWTAPSGVSLEGLFFSDDPMRARRWFGLAEEAGTYQLQLTHQGDQTLAWQAEPVRQAFEEDHLKTRANHALHQARKLRSEEDTANQAVVPYEKAISIWRQLDNKARTSDALNGQGMLFLTLNDYQEALGRFEETLALRKAIDDRGGIAQAHNNIGLAYQYLGRPSQAIPHYKQSLAIAIEDSILELIARGWMNLGGAYDQRSDPVQSLAHSERALPLFLELKDTYNVHLLKNNLGVAYNNLGEPERALAYLEDALAYFSKNRNRNRQTLCLHNMGFAYDLIGNREQAVRCYNQVIASFDEGDYSENLVKSLTAMGWMLLGEGSLDDSEAYFQRAYQLSVARQSEQDLMYTLLNLGYLKAARGDQESARRHLDKVMPFAQSEDDHRLKVAVLDKLGDMATQRQQWDQAEHYLNESITIIEQEEHEMDDLDMRARWHATRVDSYALLRDHYLLRHAIEPKADFDCKAFNTAERARARSLLRVVANTKGNYWQTLEVHWRDRLNELENNQAGLTLATNHPEIGKDGLSPEINSDLPSSGPLPVKSSPESQQEASQLRRKLELRQNRDDQGHPKTLAQIQSKLPDDGSQYLRIALGKHSSTLWLFDRKALITQSLPPREQIETLCNQIYHHYTHDTTNGALTQAERDLAEILFGAIHQRLTGRRLIVVSDGSLQLLPLAALPLLDNPNSERMIDRYEIVNLPSFSVWASMTPESWRHPGSQGTAIVFADPVFELEDTRLNGRTGTLQGALLSAKRGTEQIAYTAMNQRQWSRLRASVYEAESIQGWFTGQDTEVWTGFNASRTHLTNRRLKSDLIHIATHGWVDVTLPERSGLIFSRFTERGEPQPSVLGLYDIYDMDLDTQLVVLSACDTGIGRNLASEGLMSLTRGFMYAGAKRIIASQWKVDDTSTTRLMRAFYRALMEEGQHPATALRQAQLKLKRQGLPPLDWAAFQFHGDWR